MNVQSYTVLHYGIDYLPYALSSVYDQMEQLHVVYSPHPSHGHRADIPPIEQGGDLLKAAKSIDHQNKVHWHDVHHLWQEGQHRDWALAICKEAGADLVVVLDADEVWHADVLQKVISHAWQSNSARNWLINFTTLWRSFDWVIYDDLWPVRLIDFRHDDGIGYISRDLGSIYHFGYAVTDPVMSYKWEIHGHKSELRPNWLERKWKAWPPQPDCHPTNENGFWKPEVFNKANLPELMREHPFWDRERID